MLKAVIYDLDGTLIDSLGDLASAVNALLAELQLQQLEVATVRSFVGEGASRLVSRALAAAQPGLEARTAELMPRWFQRYGERLLDQTRAYAGIAELLREPPEARAVLTNKPGGFARQILAGLGLEGSFRAVVGGDEAERKPAPSGLLALCRKLGVLPAEALMVGDSTIDLATARAAGVRSCAVLWGLGAEAELRAARPDHWCRSPAELSALLARLRAPAT